MKRKMIALMTLLSMIIVMPGCPPLATPPATTGSDEMTVTINAFELIGPGQYALSGALPSQFGWQGPVPRGYVAMSFDLPIGESRGKTTITYTLVDGGLRQLEQVIEINTNGEISVGVDETSVGDLLVLAGLGLAGYVYDEETTADAITIATAIHLIQYLSNTSWTVNVPFAPNVLKCTIVQETSMGDFQYFLTPEEGYDADGDGLDDSWERMFFNDLSQAGGFDSDEDGLLNFEEQAWGTFPTLPDTDRDGLTDTDEIFVHNSDPLDPNDPVTVVLARYTLTTTVIGNGSIIKSVEGVVTDDTMFNASTVVMVTANPDPGWHFVSWLVNETPGIMDPDGQVTIDGDTHVVATFEEDIVVTPEEHDLTINVEGNGTVSIVAVADNGASFDGPYNDGSVVYMEATALPGWHFVNWTGDVTSTDGNEATVEMTANKSITAIFASDVVVDPGDKIRIDLDYENDILSFSATDAGSSGVIGMVFYTDSSPWSERHTFAIDSGTASGTVSSTASTLPMYLPNTIRFTIVDHATTNGWVDEHSVNVYVNGVLVLRDTDDGNGNLAYQADITN